MGVFDYFAYGSCMNFDSLSRSLGINASDYFIGCGVVSEHKVLFNYLSVNEPTCCANLVAFEGGLAEGGLFRLPYALAPLLDAREGVAIGRYEKISICAKYHGGLLKKVISYTSKHVAENEWAPSPRYRDIIVQGLSDSGTTELYREEIAFRINSLPRRLK